MAKSETIQIQKKIVIGITEEMENLIDELEMLADGTTREALNRLKDIKSGKAKTYSEEEFKALLKKEGVNV